MTGSEYRRWALDSLRSQAIRQGLQVSGAKDRPQLLLDRREGLSVSYREHWWRSGFQRSGYGGSLRFDADGAEDSAEPANVLLVNLPEFFIPMRSPEDLSEIDHFIQRLRTLAGWCVDERLEGLRSLAREAGPSLEKAYRACAIVRGYLPLLDAR